MIDQKPIMYCGLRYLPLGVAFDGCGYRPEILVVRDGIFGRLLKRFTDWHYRVLPKIARHDAITLNVPEGEKFPKWALTYWLIYPIKIINRFAKRVPYEW